MVATNAYPAMGGVETHLHEVAPRITRAGFDVTILATDRSGTLPASQEVDGVVIRRVRAWPANRDYYFAPAMYRVITGERWDLVHCHGYHTFVAPLAMLAALRARVPYVLTFHSGGHGSRLRNRLRKVQYLTLRPLLSRARRLIAVSEFEAGFLPRLLRLPPSRFVTIPNGASMDAPVDPPPADPDETLILSVGRLERYKGHHRVVAALPHLLRHEPSARLRIVGAGPFEADLREIARGNGVAERVDIGPVDPRDRGAMATLLGRASLVTLLSEYEANPVAVMEALALRRRVLLADTSGLSELARRGLARAVPLDSSPEQVARAMLDQLRSPPPSDLELPTWDACAARIADVYRSIIGLPGAASNGSRTRTATSGVTAHR
jgi:glycosyltransferase involved in cell wall biosynthesis